MNPIPLNEVAAQLERCLHDGDMATFEHLLWPALDQMPEVPHLWYYAGHYFQRTARNAMAFQCFRRGYELEPIPAALSNMGACLTYMGMRPAAREVLRHAIARDPNDVHAHVNLCGTYVNEGDPLPGIEAGERALSLDGTPEGKFNLALLHLEAGNFARGFDLYTEGKHRHREDRDYFTPETEPPVLTPELHEQLTTRPFIEGGGRRPLLIVWGEQGIGDELMFGTMLADVIRDYDVVLDCHPRLEHLHQTSSWAGQLRAEGRPVNIVPTRKERGDPLTRPIGVAHGQVAAKVAIGDLCRIYRRTRDSFTWQGPTYSAPLDEAAEMRARLERMAGGRRIVALATRGGTVSTATRYRRLPQKQLEQLFADKTTFYVGVDYEDMTGVAAWANEKFPGAYYWPASVNFAWDYHHVAALLAACDALITVPQSVMHLACGMGLPTHVLTPSCPDWRLGIAGNFVWYPSDHVRLHRQTGSDWEPVIMAAQSALEARFREAA